MTISERVFKIMEEKGLSQIEFSRQTGIPQSTISDWKRKKTNPASDKILAICDALSVSPYEVLQDTSEHNNALGYRVVSAGTPAYELLVEIDSLKPLQRERLMGYLNALK